MKTKIDSVANSLGLTEQLYSDAKTGLNEVLQMAKTGILEVKDFYADEVYWYFFADVTYPVFISLLLIGIYLIFHTRLLVVWKNSVGKSGDGWLLVPVYSWMGLAACCVALVLSLKDVFIFIVAPKIYITKELIHLFQ